MKPQSSEKSVEMFRKIYIHENLWKSSDESEAYSSVENMENFVRATFEAGYRKGVEDALEVFPMNIENEYVHVELVKKNISSLLKQ